MAQTTNLISNNFPGYGLLEGRCLPCSGVTGRVVALSSSSSLADQRIYSHVKSGSLKCTQRRVLNVCNASSSGHRRNPDFSRQNRNSFRGRNRPNEDRDRDSFESGRNRPNEDRDRDSFESIQESDMLSSKNGPLLSLSSSPKFQATAAPGPREKEIVELFRKVQAQLRERAAVKEDKKIETSQGQGKASETVDSLLKLLRKHSVEQGKRKGSSSSSDFSSYESEQHGEYSEDRRKHSVEQGMRKDNTTTNLDKNSYQYNKQNGKYNEDRSISYPDSRSNVRDDAQESKPSSLARPPSSFRRRSPVRQVKFHPSSRDNVVNSVYSSVQIKKHLVDDAVPEYEPAQESEQEPKPEPELELEPYEDKDIIDDVSSILEDSDDDEDDEDEKEEKRIVDEDLSAMKLSELRAIAKSRGLKGYSKLKKVDLLELLAVN